MKGIELAPFRGKFERIGPNITADSVVGKIERSSQVVKWSRENFATPEEAECAAQQIQRSVNLYKKALGENFVVPTQVCVGQKQDNGRVKNKVYIQQPHIDGWEGDDLPNEIRKNPFVQSQWKILYERLSKLYQSAGEAQRTVIDPDRQNAFPVNTTLGITRIAALEKQLTCSFPQNPNLLVERDTLQIKLFDWGPYSQWTDSMESSYGQISKLVSEQ